MTDARIRQTDGPGSGDRTGAGAGSGLAIPARRPTRKSNYFTSSRWHDLRWGYGLALPAIALTAVFVVYPLARSVYLTFFDYEFIMNRQQFAGFQNYIDWIQDPEMWHSAWIALKYFLLYVPPSMFLALIIALAIDRLARKHFQNLYRAIFYFPVVLPAAIVFQMWMWIYDPTVGVITQTLRELGSSLSIDWLGDADTALAAIAAMSIWRVLGETVIFFLVGLSTVPRELLESARVDGARELSVIFRIQLPLLIPMIVLVLVLRLRVLEASTEMLYMTQGGPIDATMTYGLQAYMLFSREDQIGYANTWFIMLAVVSIALAWAASHLRKMSS
ncbi:carbohydrate ABC transporter permease [Brachybacterium vulturis]|uniref:carbohydrate ABC transporter permease n=1 Tax=Brachybacterium vulturis TaxID=2017484 RepID=UPI0037370AD9